MLNLFISTFMVFALSSCKTSTLRKKNLAVYDSSTESTLVSEPQADIELNLFDDDEAILIFTNDDAFELDENFDGSLAVAALEGMTIAYLKENPVEENSTVENLALTVRVPSNGGKDLTEAVPDHFYNKPDMTSSPTKKPSVTKSLIRNWERLQRLLRGSPEDYFNKAITKKWNDPHYSKFDRMQSITTRVDIGGPLPTDKGSNVVLGMLPNSEIFQQVRKQFAKSVEDEDVASIDFRVVSILEEFEMKRISDDLNENYIKTQPQVEAPSIRESNNRSYRSRSGRRYAVSYEIDPETSRRIGVNSWTRYSTPDRTMMNHNILADAINDVLDSIKKGHPIYVDCKSGKGRSATVVVGARASFLIDQAATYKKGRLSAGQPVLSKKEIEQIVNEQISQVKERRSEIGISFAQKTNLMRVLMIRAGHNV